MSERPTLEDLRQQLASRRVSRFHKAKCTVCGKPVTNQAMGRKAHMEAHKRADAKKKAEAEQCKQRSL